MNKKVVVINGTALAGKGTFCMLCNKYVPCKEISTVDKVKEAYRLLGWNGEKTEIDRKNLSDLKDMSTMTFDHPYNYISHAIKRFRFDDNQILFVDSREPNEIFRFVKEFGCVTLLIKNSSISNLMSNHADAEVDNYNYDYIVTNDYDMGTFEQEAIKFIEWLKEQNQ